MMQKIHTNTPLLSILLACCMSLLACNDSNDVAMSPTGTGKGGSMARFTVAGDHLYVVDSRNLHVYDVTDATTPQKTKEVPLGVDIETIFPYQQKLFIGSMDGMHIYSLADPENPLHLSTYNHVTSCDPVVVQGNLAYVTLRSGSSCMRGNNQLDIIDISRPENPRLINSYQMTNPFGLGIDGNTLFVCEGANGLKVLNVEDPSNIQEIASHSDKHAFDVIPGNNNLILTGADGVFQYNYAQPEQLVLNSAMNISNVCE